MLYDKALKLVETEYSHATRCYGAFKSAHEGFAIIMEEYEELKAEVFKKQAYRHEGLMIKEAKQLAAMAIRFLVDIC
jgi:hypothetical protein